MNPLPTVSSLVIAVLFWAISLAPVNAAPCGTDGTLDFDFHSVRVKAGGKWYKAQHPDFFHWVIWEDISGWPNKVDLEVVWKHTKNVSSSAAYNAAAYNSGNACLNDIDVGTTKQVPNFDGAVYTYQIPKTATDLSVRMTTTLAYSSHLFSYANFITIKHLIQFHFPKVLIETPTQNQMISAGSPVVLKLKPLTPLVDPAKIDSFQVDWEWYWTAAEQIGSKNPLPEGWNSYFFEYRKWKDFPLSKPVGFKDPRKYRVRVTPLKWDGSTDGYPTPWVEFTIVKP